MSNPGLEFEGSVRNTKASSHDLWVYGGGDAAWPSLEAALLKIEPVKRYGTTFGVEVGDKIVEYWWPDKTKIADADVLPKELDFPGKEELLALLGLDQLDNTSDLNKPVSNSTRVLLDEKASFEELETAIQDVNTKIEESLNSVEVAWSETLRFTYTGNKTFNLAYTPYRPLTAHLDGWPDDPNFDKRYLDAFSDYRFENKTVILNLEGLMIGVTYLLLITYFK